MQKYYLTNLNILGTTYLDRLLDRDSDFAEEGDLDFQVQGFLAVWYRKDLNANWSHTHRWLQWNWQIMFTCPWRSAACHVTCGHYMTCSYLTQVMFFLFLQREANIYNTLLSLRTFIIHYFYVLPGPGPWPRPGPGSRPGPRSPATALLNQPDPSPVQLLAVQLVQSIFHVSPGCPISIF